MVPNKLKLSNFTSYGTNVPELDFTSFHMAAISGQNGAGKSSLLDSITWCLWGSSRLGDSTDQLIRLGQQIMFVEFSFQLDGHLYTVKRQRVLKGGGTTSLEFLSGSASSPQAHNLTEGTIKATQQKIIDTLHLTYETFVNSAFIRQGHADEFTTKGPSDRKRILADILGLAHYEVLEEKAKEKVKEVQTKLQLLEYQLLEIEAELSQKEEREKALSEAEKEAEEAEKELKQVEQRIKLIEAEEKIISVKIKSLEEAEERIKTAHKELEDLKLQISLKERSQSEYQEVLKQRKEIEDNFSKLKGFIEKKKTLDSKRSDLITVKDELADLQKVIIERDNKRNQAITELQVQIKKLQTETEQLETQNKHLKEHKDSCPTCGQAIGIEKNSEIIKKNSTAIAEYDASIKEFAGKLDKFQKFVFPESIQAKEKEQVIETLEQETKDYQYLTQQISTLGHYENLYLKLQQAETAVKTQEEAALDLKKIYQTKEEQIKKEEQTLEGLEEQQKQFLEIRNKIQAEESVKEELAKTVSEKRGKAGEAKQLVSRAKQLEGLQEEKQKNKNKLAEEKGAFEELALAFGKKGIQAMIIESAIPEIEDEANRLLDRLTEGRMKVHFETQRETKTKTAGEYGTVETLDIIISDEMGERPYEAYSGGEQFRVNFAMRLALSKLLTHRAGARLQFLVVDEGFGTQDAEGRARIVEALDAIKDDFEKILIITHLEELKEEFPVRIEVQKGSTGSTFEVVGV